MGPALLELVLRCGEIWTQAASVHLLLPNMLPSRFFKCIASEREMGRWTTAEDCIQVPLEPNGICMAHTLIAMADHSPAFHLLIDNDSGCAESRSMLDTRSSFPKLHNSLSTVPYPSLHISPHSPHRPARCHCPMKSLNRARLRT
jgi:hypothetical protein